MEISARLFGIWIVFVMGIAVGVEGVALNAACTSGGTACTDTNAECRDDGAGFLCLCASTYYEKSDGVCTLQIDLDATCLTGESASQCDDALAECREDSGLKCKCKAANYDNSGTCAARKAPAANCASGECVEHATCDTTCKCNTGYTASPTASPTMCSANGVIKFASLSYMYLVPILLSMMSLLR